jgi:hypothetical protein
MATARSRIRTAHISSKRRYAGARPIHRHPRRRSPRDFRLALELPLQRGVIEVPIGRRAFFA